MPDLAPVRALVEEEVDVEDVPCGLHWLLADG